MTLRVFITALAISGSLSLASPAMAQFGSLDFPVLTFPEDDTGSRSKVKVTQTRD